VLPKQRRSTLAMLQKVGVTPAETRVRAGEPALGELTGAQQPSGVPIADEPPPPRRPRPGGGYRSAREDRPFRARNGHPPRRGEHRDRRPAAARA